MNFTRFEQKTIDAIEDCKGAIKHCAENSIAHLQKAWVIKDIDKEMSVFRGITAEEEAASALFFCLKINRYKNADKILFKKHTYKLGLYQFLMHVRNHLAGCFGHDGSPFDKFRLHHVELPKRRAIELAFSIKGHGLDARPKPPLHFSISEETEENESELKTFNVDFKKLHVGEKYKDSLKYIQEVASIRNHLLYAKDSGPPKLEIDIEKYLEGQKKRVFIFLTLILLIDPWEKEIGPSSFVQQVLDSFLLLLERISKEEIFAQPSAPPDPQAARVR